jgi:L-alanine-DL-glutamate epimerase-like enolase superfamily enzyme
MARIERVELRLIDIPPKVKRTDAIQSFVSQETPIVTVTDSDGAAGTGYSYTIGTGASSVMRLLSDHLAPRLIGKDAERVEAIWRELEFATHATTIGAISSLALAAIDTALWDLRAKRRQLPLWIVAGGAADRRPLYTTEGGPSFLFLGGRYRAGGLRGPAGGPPSCAPSPPGASLRGREAAPRHG